MLIIFSLKAPINEVYVEVARIQLLILLNRNVSKREYHELNKFKELFSYLRTFENNKLNLNAIQIEAQNYTKMLQYLNTSLVLIVKIIEEL
jgi:hypothetical protein